jgi:hypothetical protein
MINLNLKEALSTSGAELDDKQTKFIDSLDTAISNKLTENTKSNSDKLESINEQMLKFSAELAKYNNITATIKPEARDSLFNVVSKEFNNIKNAIKTGKELHIATLALSDFKLAAAPHQTNNGTVTLGNATMPIMENFTVDRTPIEIKKPQGFLGDIIRNVEVANLEYSHSYVDEVAGEGTITTVAEAAEKPLIQYKFALNAVTRQKLAGRVEYSEEFNMDLPELLAAIIDMLQRDIVLAWHNWLFTNIILTSNTYVPGPYSGTMPFPNANTVANVLADIIGVAGFSADTVVLNNFDYTILSNQVDATGRLLNIPELLRSRFSNVIVTPLLTSDKILVFDSSVFLEKHTPTILKVGQYGNQFRDNMYTVIAEKFALYKLSANKRNGSLYGDISVIAADIEDPAPNIPCCNNAGSGSGSGGGN